MNRAPVDTSYREAASILPPQAVSEYLSLSQWQLERRDEIKEIWRLNDADGETIGRLMLPLDTDYSDFHDRFYDALRALAYVNGWNAYQLQDEILAARADLLFVRLDQPTADGTISFRQAEVTMRAIYTMIRSSAQEAAASAPSGQYQQPATIDHFLNEDVRLGHTKNGSFIFTVAARFHDTTGQDRPQEDTKGVGPVNGIFARRVMQTLAQNLETTRTITGNRSRNISNDIIEQTTPAYPALLKSLEDITKPEGLRSVELSFQWAVAVPRPDVGTDPIKLDRDAVPILSRARKTLRARPAEQEAIAGAPPHTQTIAGPVISLARESTGPNTGEIVVFADTGHGRHNIHVELSGENHDWAIQAYKARVPLTLSGALVHERGRWRLIGPIDLDISALK